MVPVREDYAAYRAPAWVVPTVHRLLASLTPQHVGGLSAIVLTDSTRVTRDRRLRVVGGRSGKQGCLGLYRRRWRGEPASVVLVVDRMLDGVPWWGWLIPLSKDTAIARVLFHEIGHHLNGTVGSHAAGEEASADAWERRLWRVHARRHRLLLSVLRPPARLTSRLLKRYRRRTDPSASGRRLRVQGSQG